MFRLPRFPAFLLSFCLPFLLLSAIVLLTGCSLPQIKAEDRLFLPLSLDFLGEYRLPKADFENAPIGGLSGLAYDRQRDRFYAVSDDRSERAPARFYTLKLDIGISGAAEDAETSGAIGIRSVEIEQVTTLKGEDNQPYAEGTIDSEGIALSPRRTLFITSEGVTPAKIPPFIHEFELESGNWRSRLAVPKRFLPQEEEGQLLGVQNNRGFEALTVNAGGAAPNSTEPYRLFTATEAPIAQDLPLADADNSSTNPPAQQPLRFLHYLVGDELPLLLAEHLYLIDPPPSGATENGLVELISLDQGGHFLSLERSFGASVGVGAKLYELAIGGATDTSSIPYLQGNITGIVPIAKRLLLDLSELNIPLDNVEGMTIGPQLPDGSQSLILISDDNFNPLQVTQLLLFRLKNSR
ncbi:esterase-like activity of phytase family protein [Leptolyngbya sp. GB1-A1]|uniref:esterase-like activity of phytase family protein n=1 Tax=Leptolyngbya sp. GB1-A1 TaxID=2933908 RepID=UPI00329746CB